MTGATSLLGASVVTALRDRGADVVVMQRRPSGLSGVTEQLGDITDAGAVARAVAGCESVVHLAARVAAVGAEAEFIAANVEGSATVVAAAEAAGVDRFVHISTPSVAHAGASLVGAAAGVADPGSAIGHYARTKAEAELLVLAANRPGFSAVALRPHLVWGPGDTQLIERVVSRARAGRLALVGSGAALIDTTYVTNAADAIVAGLDRCHDVAGRALVISNGQPRPVEEIFHRVCAAAGIAWTPRYVPLSVAANAGSVVEVGWSAAKRSDDPPMTRFLAEQLGTAHWFDQREVQRLLRWKPAVDLEDGFAALRTWYVGAS